MSVQYLDSPSAPLSYEQLTQWAIDVNSSQGYNVNEYLSYINTTYPNADLTDFMLEQTDRVLDYVQNGDGTYTVLGYRTPIQSTTMPDPFNSNVSQVSRGSIRQAINDGVKNVGGTIQRNMTTFPASGSFAQQASYVIGSVGSAIAAVSTGITLGKVIDSALYNANPDYWNSIGMQTLNPETWNTITNGDDSPFAGLFNLILGLDPNTGNSQMYMDQNSFAYLAYALAQNGWFNQATTEQASYNGTNLYYQNGVKYTQPINISTGFSFVRETSTSIFTYNVSAPSNCYIVPFRYGDSRGAWVCSKNNLGPGFILGTRTYYNKSTGSTTVANITYDSTGNLSTWNGNRFYDNTITLLMSDAAFDECFPNANIITAYFNDNNFAKDIATIIFDGTITSPSSTPGISNQDNANLPDVSTWDSPQNALTSLQNQYPDLWNNAIGFDNIQPDGSVNRTTYVPVAMPNFNYNNDQQPVSGTQQQSQTQYNPTTTDANILQLLTDTITAPQTQTSSETITPPANPVDTGIGSSPTPIATSGSASALWSVYHPTQAQVNSFGSWLWGSPFLTNIGKLFQNPIDGVISLHKIFATPIDSGTGNIVVGTLDSGVSSATVNQQYVTVDCGYVDCHEVFGNVFDYPPFTQVSIYLPFIGIVPLDVNDVMRSTIHVIYGVDVYTGSCLAMIEVTRDGSTVNMYQHSGVASVEYPLSNVQNSQMLSGLLMIAGGIASVAITGGASAPAAAGAVSASIGGVTSTMKSNVGKSGGFSGNAGAMGIKKPYLIIQRPQTKVAETFPRLEGYSTNYSCRLGDCSNHVVVKSVHVEGIPATDTELAQIETLLKDGVLI